MFYCSYLTPQFLIQSSLTSYLPHSFLIQLFSKTPLLEFFCRNEKEAEKNFKNKYRSRAVS